VEVCLDPISWVQQPLSFVKAALLCGSQPLTNHGAHRHVRITLLWCCTSARRL
jgi:hypothetical protein